ncbi:MAG: HD domain-containing protein [Pirellulales bacterium]
MSQAILPGVFPDYLIPIANELSYSYEYLRFVASGKNGAVHLIKSKNSEAKLCLKTIKKEFSDSSTRSRAIESITKEIDILTPLDHNCFPTIYQKNANPDLPYYVCDFHPGKTFEAFAKDNDIISTQEAIHAVNMLIDAFEYLHDHDRAHCDFHYNNVMISGNVYKDGILIIDFGSGHRLSDSAQSTLNQGDFRHKDIESQIQFKSRVNRKAHSSHFAQSDFKSLGHQLAIMTKSFFANAPIDQQRSYMDFCRALQNLEFTNWQEVKDAFASVADPRHLMSSVDKCFSNVDGKPRYIRIPVSGDIQVGKQLLDIINTSVFQRLRRIKQLSFCDWIFPGGCHTRFEHVIGVMNLTKLALESLCRQPDFIKHHSKSAISGTLFAALIHDLGHYPFAHVVEQYTASRFPDEQEAKDAVDHEKHSLQLIESDPEILNALKSWEEHTGTIAHKVIAKSMGVLSEILSGPIDCDKLDYICRDAYHCGKQYGKGIDTSALVKAFTYDDTSDSLCIDQSRIPAVEGFIVAQEQMLREVYWHDSVRAITAMFHAAIAAIVLKDKKSLKALIDKLKIAESDEFAIREILIPAFRKKIELDPSRIPSRFLALLEMHVKGSYADIYKNARKYDRGDRVPSQHPTATKTIYDTIVTSPGYTTSSIPINYDEVKRLRYCYMKTIERISPMNNLSEFDILIDVPYGKSKITKVQVRMQSGELKDLSTLTHIHDSILSEMSLFSAPIRIFFSPLLYRHIGDKLNQICSNAEKAYFTTTESDSNSIL